MVRFEVYPKLPLFMGKFSFLRLIYGKKLDGNFFSVPMNCSLIELKEFLVCSEMTDVAVE